VRQQLSIITETIEASSAAAFVEPEDADDKAPFEDDFRMPRGDGPVPADDETLADDVASDWWLVDADDWFTPSILFRIVFITGFTEERTTHFSFPSVTLHTQNSPSAVTARTRMLTIVPANVVVDAAVFCVPESTSASS
jgi:hypothetical protein